MTPLAALMLVFVTIPVVAICVIASFLRVPIRHGSIYEAVQGFWARALVFGGGVRRTIHNPERIERQAACVYVANHVSWYDVFTLASVLPRWSFVAKDELRKIPVFGRGATAVGTVFIERQNRRAAVQMYEKAAMRIGEGASVVVFAEGSRGDSYALRQFKKGPFVLAISAGIPIIPVVIMGTREVMARGSYIVRPHRVHLHFLEPIPTAGLSYQDRERLVAQVWTSMANVLESEYGVTSERGNALGADELAERDATPRESGMIAQ
jgi:1-acyl-sn-glycerol-3-phosphate acyltransferase